MPVFLGQMLKVLVLSAPVFVYRAMLLKLLKDTQAKREFTVSLV